MFEVKDVRLTNPSIKVDADVKVKQDFLGDPIRIKSVGGRRWFIAGAVVFATIILGDISLQLGTANELKKEDIKVKKEQLELARRQFMLDSIAMEQNKNMR